MLIFNEHNISVICCSAVIQVTLIKRIYKYRYYDVHIFIHEFIHENLS